MVDLNLSHFFGNTIFMWKTFHTKNIAKKKIKKFIETTFKCVEKNKFYLKVKKLNLIIKIILFLFFFVWFIIGTILIQPIPFGNTALFLWLIILFPIQKVKSILQYFIQKLRVNQLYAKRLLLKYKIKHRTCFEKNK